MKKHTCSRLGTSNYGKFLQLNMGMKIGSTHLSLGHPKEGLYNSAEQKKLCLYVGSKL